MSKTSRREAWNRFADAGRALLVGGAIVLPRRRHADAARIGAGASLVSIKVLTKVLKKLVPEQRPNRQDNQSFPSAHAAECVAAAVLISREYPAVIGGAAYALAGTVAVARVESRKHHFRDVVAGAAIGSVSVWIGLQLRLAIERRLVKAI